MALIIILFSAVTIIFILYSAVGNAASPILVDSQSEKYLDKLNVNPNGQNSTSNPYGVIVSSDTGIFQYEIT